MAPRDVVTELRRRYEAIGPPGQPVRRDTLTTDDRPPISLEFGVVTAVIVDDEDPDKTRIRWRPVKYKSNPPVEGDVEISGYEYDGYPVPGWRVSSYEVWKLRDEIDGFNFCPVLLARAGGVNVLVWFGKPESTPLRDALPPSWFEEE